MFKHEFQGGPFVELFSVQGKDPLSKVKISGSHTSFRKEFDPDLRTFVLCLDGEPSTTKLIFPKNSKQSLHIVQPFLVFQVFIQSGRSFSLEVTLTDHKNLKQRLIFSNSNREVIVTALHVKMPCSVITTNRWLNLCLDLNGLLSSTNDRFSILDSFVVSANCSLRRVFSLKNRPESDVDIPKNVYLGDVPTVLQLLDLESFVNAGINIREGTGRKLNRANAYVPLSSSSERSHIAFGSRTLIRRNSTPREDISIATSRLEKSSRTPKKEIDLNNNSIGLQNSANENKEVLLSSRAMIVPRPPKQNSGRVRKPRIKSADYSKQVLRHENGVEPLSKSADTRGRKIVREVLRSDTVDKSNHFNEVADETIEKLRPLQMRKKLSQSSFELGTNDIVSRDHATVLNRDCRSKSLSVLPNIKSSSTKDDELIKNEQSELASLDDNVFVSSSQENDLPLEMGDDVMIEEYLLHRTTSECTHDDSLSSSCTASVNSDLFLYSSRPKSVSSQPLSKSNSDSLNWDSYEESIKKRIDITNVDKPFGEQQLSSGIGSSLSLNDEEEERKVEHQEDTNYLIGSPVFNSSPSSSFSITDKVLSETQSDSVSATEANKTYNVDKKETSEKEDLPDFHHYRPADSLEADSMSWLRTSNEYSETSESVALLNGNGLHNGTGDKIKPPTKNTPLRQRLLEQLGSMIVQSKDIDTDDGFSDCSDDTTVAEPPAKFQNYRYQDEMKSICSTIDLSATIPATPQVGEQAIGNGIDQNNNGGRHPLKQSKDEELLDLLFDPVLNCYYDPKTEKYYELS